MSGWSRPQGAPLVVVDRLGRETWSRLAEYLPGEPLAVCRGVDPWQLAADVRMAVDDGCRFVVCVGGDGAYLAATAGSRGVSGILVGHGGGPASLPRSYGLPADPERAARRLVSGDAADLDTLLIKPTRGEPVECVNMAGWGFLRAAGYLGGKYGRWRAGLRLGSLYPLREEIEVAMGELTRVFRASGFVVANGQFLAELSFVPSAHPGDGKLEILVFEGPARDMWRILPRLHTGTHLPHPRVRELRPIRAHVDGSGRIFADGVDVSRLPATFEVCPGRLQLAL